MNPAKDAMISYGQNETPGDSRSEGFFVISGFLAAVSDYLKETLKQEEKFDILEHPLEGSD